MKKENTKHRLFIDMDGVIAEWRGHCKFEDLFEEYYFSTLEPQMWIINSLKEYLFINAGEVELYVITSVLMDSPYALNEKKEWLDNHFNIPESHRIFVTNGDNKAEYVPGGIQPTDILLDDFSVNLHKWEESGGKGIKVLNGWNWTKKTWQGLLLPKFESTSTLTRLISKALGETI